MEELIIDKARALFFSYGVKSVSMDDISRDAAISKKTIYKSFDDKNQLVTRLVEDLISCAAVRLEKCKREASDAVGEVMLFAQTTLDIVGQISPNFFFELKKFCPGVWKKVEAFDNNLLLPLIAGNLKKGINDEVYRADIDVAFTSDLRLQQIRSVLNVKNHAGKLQSNRLMMQLTEFYLHAITTPKGKKLIHKYLIEHNETQFSN
jgi:AcrR family transcriptional regulator